MRAFLYTFMGRRGNRTQYSCLQFLASQTEFIHNLIIHITFVLCKYAYLFKRPICCILKRNNRNRRNIWVHNNLRRMKSSVARLLFNHPEQIIYLTKAAIEFIEAYCESYLQIKQHIRCYQSRYINSSNCVNVSCLLSVKYRKRSHKIWIKRRYFFSSFLNREFV